MYLLLLIASTHAYASISNLDWSNLLFSQSKTWQSVQLIESASAKAEQNRVMLTESFKFFVKQDSSNCDLMARILDKPAKSFYYIDINADGAKDILYSGNAKCSEGGITLTWLNKSKIYEFVDKFPFQTDALLLRVNPGKEPSFVALIEGCCDSFEDEYFMFTPEAGRQTVVLAKLTEFPSTPLKQSKEVVVNSELVLRWSANADDSYNIGESEHLDTAVFGNILAKYLGGAKVTVLAEKNVKGVKWSFIKIDGNNNRLRYYATSKANVGWARIEQ